MHGVIARRLACMLTADRLCSSVSTARLAMQALHPTFGAHAAVHTSLAVAAHQIWCLDMLTGAVRRLQEQSLAGFVHTLALL